MPGALFWLLLPLHLALNMVSIVWFAFRGQRRVMWRAKRDAVAGLPKSWRKREEIQTSRATPSGALWQVLDKQLLPICRRF